jgi:hypothetical protein
MKQLICLLMGAALLTNPQFTPWIGAQSSEGQQGSYYEDSNCEPFETMNKTCKTILATCTGQCIYYTYDRSCGQCVERYLSSGCRSWVGRTALRKDSGLRDCVQINYQFSFTINGVGFGGPYSKCECPPMGTPSGEGTLIQCPCAS